MWEADGVTSVSVFCLSVLQARGEGEMSKSLWFKGG